jgi:hypothetical protein
MAQNITVNFFRLDPPKPNNVSVEEALECISQISDLKDRTCDLIDDVKGVMDDIQFKHGVWEGQFTKIL